MGGRAVASHCSVATPDFAETLVDLALQQFGDVDTVVHNAGVWRNVPIDDMSLDDLQPVLDVHLRAAFLLIRATWPAMKATQFGRIVLISSGSGRFGREAGPNYAAAKAGLYGLSRAAHLEGIEHGIKTNCVLPVAVCDGAGVEPTPQLVRHQIVRAIDPLRSRMQPERVAPLVAYLASPACAVSGEAFSAVAGRYARVYAAVTQGWMAPNADIATAEDIASHLTEIRDTGAFTSPLSQSDEIETVARAVKTVQTMPVDAAQ